MILCSVTLAALARLDQQDVWQRPIEQRSL
jgi:hypothetical protein